MAGFHQGGDGAAGSRVTRGLEGSCRPFVVIRTVVLRRLNPLNRDRRQRAATSAGHEREGLCYQVFPGPLF
jgi:hypothetical protein